MKIITHGFRILSCFLVLVFLSAGSAYPESLADDSDYQIDSQTDYSDIDYRASNTPDYAGKNLESLSSYLIEKCSSEREKARSIFRWIAENISYDSDRIRNEQWKSGRNLTAEEVLIKRKAICGGYANLYHSLALLAGLECMKISGKAKGFLFSKGSDTLSHAWNAVKIDGKWRLLDSTWGAGYIEVKSGGFKKEFQPYYFLTPSEKLIYSHLPEDPHWQLLENKVSDTQFYKSASLLSGFFCFGFDPASMSHKDFEIDVGNRVKLEFQGERDVFLMATIKKDDRIFPATSSIEGENGNYSVTVFFPSSGDYDLHLFARRGSRQGEYAQFINYKVHAGSGIQVEKAQGEILVQPSDAFFNHGFTLDSLSHKTYRHRAEGKFSFELSGRPGMALLARLSKNGTDIPDHTMIQEEDGGYTVTVVFPSSGEYELTVFGKTRRDEGLYPHYFKYLIDANVYGYSGKSGFPVFYQSYLERKCHLRSPLTKYLESGQTHSFDLSVPGALKVAVVVNDKWNQLRNEGQDNFAGDLLIQGTKVTVYALFQSGDNYHGLVSFESE